MKWLLCLLCLFSWQLAAVEVFFDDFEASTQTGWSYTNRASASAFSTFLGRFGYTTVGLNLSNLASHTTVTLEFDLYIIDSWDGESFQVQNSGSTLWSASFDNHMGASQSYTARTGDTFRAELAFSGTGYYDSIYHKVNGGITFSHTASTLALTFSGYPNETIDNESWGIDNVRILTNATVPEAGTSVMFMLGFLAAFAVRCKSHRN